MPAESRGPRIISVCGKGGVGKTSVSAALVRALVAGGAGRVLAIDADPAVGLATALGVTVKMTVDDIRNKLIDRLESGAKEDRRELVSLIDYEVFEALVEKKGLAFLAIGRPETEGCYCQVNDILKDIIASTAGGFDYVVIDGEAGIEQVNRRVMETVTDLLLVSDASAKGLNVARDDQGRGGPPGRAGTSLAHREPCPRRGGDEAPLPPRRDRPARVGPGGRRGPLRGHRRREPSGYAAMSRT